MTAPTDINKENRYKGYIDAFLAIFIWSGFVIVSRIGGKSVLLPFDVVALRFGTASLILLPFWAWKIKTNLLQWKMLALALTGGIGYALFAYLGFKNAPATHGAILITGLLPFQIILFSWLTLHERPTVWRIAGLFGIGLGVACLGMETFQGEAGAWIGDVAFAAASTSWAIYTVLVRKWKISVWDATIGSALGSAILYLPVYVLFLPKHIDIAPWQTIGLQAFYQGFMAVIVAMALYMRAIRALGPTKVGLCMALVPAISGLAASLLLGESLTFLTGLGLALTSFGAWLGNRK